jgi:hypothetical protein
MGCDIHCYAEKRTKDGWEMISGLCPFDWRNYGMYGFLADVRNYSSVPPIAEPRGFPDDASEEVQALKEDWDCDAHSSSWLTVNELLTFNYDAPMEDRRVMRQVGPNAWDGGCTCEPGEGQQTTFREFLGKTFFEDLEKLKASGAERIVFWFDC